MMKFGDVSVSAER